MKFLPLLLCTAALHGWRYEERVLFVHDSVEQRCYIEVEGHQYEISGLQHSTWCPCTGHFVILPDGIKLRALELLSI